MLDPAAEANEIGAFRTRELPGIGVTEPIVGQLDLVAVSQLLPEHAVFVANAVADARQSEIGHGIKKAGGETTEATVAECGIDLLCVKIIERNAMPAESLGQCRFHAKCAQGVLEIARHEEFHGQVRHLFQAASAHQIVGLMPALNEISPDSQCSRMEPMTRSRLAHLYADVLRQVRDENIVNVRTLRTFGLVIHSTSAPAVRPLKRL